jgi:glycosyltransferase involved in cell wall biosynthesis
VGAKNELAQRTGEQLAIAEEGRMTKPLVSVLMCTYNGIGFIERAVRDILAQSYKNFELLVSDDGSSDGTAEWLHGNSADPRIRLYIQPQNLGYVANKNFLLERASGELITQMDQDDGSPRGRLAKMVEEMLRSKCSIVGCGYQRMSSDGSLLDVTAPEQATIISTPPAEGENYPFWFPALLARRGVFDAVGSWNTYFAGTFGDDLYWTVRANEQFPILCLPDVLYFYRDTPASITSSLDRPRKLTAGRILNVLLSQRSRTGTDDLEQDNISALDAIEHGLLRDRSFMASQVQLYAARAIDHGRYDEALSLLRRAALLAPWRPSLLRTMLYWLRSNRH